MDVPRISMDIQRCPAHSPLLCVVVVCTPLVITRFPKDFLELLGSLEDFLGCSNVSKAVRMHLNDFHADFVKVRIELLISLGVVDFRVIPMVFVCISQEMHTKTIGITRKYTTPKDIENRLQT